MTIDEYIKSKDIFRLMPFVTIYTTICELLNDGFIDEKAFEKAGGSDVAASKLKPKGEKCRGLHCQGDCHCNKESVG